MPQAAAAPTVAGKAQALAQESEAATIKLQDDDEESGADVLEELDKKASKPGKKSKHGKRDLAHHVDSELAKLKGKGKRRQSKRAKDTEEVEDIDDKDEPDLGDAADTDSKTAMAEDLLDKLDDRVGAGASLASRLRYLDADRDDYAFTREDIHNKVDGLGAHPRDLDLYDIFRDFDRDGDGIVDDVDLDDPRWTERCKKNHYDILDDFDEGFFRAGRYRGLTDEEWTAREAQQQKNLDELLAKQKELEQAHSEVQSALKALSGDKEQIDSEIKAKVKETEQLRIKLRKKAAERAEAERKAAIEREKQ